LPTTGGTIEPKPNEPEGHSFCPTTGHALAIYSVVRTRPSGSQTRSHSARRHDPPGPLTASGWQFSCGSSFSFTCNQIKGSWTTTIRRSLARKSEETVHMFWQLGELGWKVSWNSDCHMLRARPTPISRTRGGESSSRTAAQLCLCASARRPPHTVHPRLASGEHESMADLFSIMAIARLARRQ